MTTYYTTQTNFYGKTTPYELIKEYGSPVYIYNENILRQRCREMKNLISYPNFRSNYSIKANSSLELLKIVKDEGLCADAMSPGEIHVLITAGFKPEEILYIGNNVSAEEMKFAIERNVMVSVDSIAQLRLYGKINPGSKVAVRFNPGIGAGHHEKVVTAGKKTKFGVNVNMVDEVKSILKEYNLKLTGINQHIGSLFMQCDSYLEGVRSLLDIARHFQNLDFIDMGGGFGIPYHKQEGEIRLDIEDLGNKLTQMLIEWTREYGKEVQFKIEPGRYIVAECGVLLGTVYSNKQNYDTAYVGTDLGFNVLARPVMYDSFHDIEVYNNAIQGEACQNQTDPYKTEESKTPEDKTSEVPAAGEKVVTVVGNICESGDIIARERKLPQIDEGEILGIMDAGAYGYVMSSNYNNRLRPAEVLIQKDGNHRLIRRRDTIEDLMRNFV